MLWYRTPRRRKLRFGSYEQILSEVDRLAPAHRTLGNWTLAQICEHLFETQTFSVEPWEPEIRTSRLFQATIGRIALCVLLWFRFIPEQQGNLGPRPPVDLQAARGHLNESIRRLSSEPTCARHPIFGGMTAAQWRQFHLHHAAHHLSFVIPECSRP
ncbi:MAG TPA: DUF1569 domain-containing protein [Phycisphaerae bacterium]|nr:DUF1569 domain-containing protein [Phycisphaerae bacterium]